MSDPILKPVFNGWTASGQGWAVHAPTREEAIEKFRQAEKQHQEVLARRPIYERREATLKAVAHAIRESLEST